jgi:hypothetical protein
MGQEYFLGNPEFRRLVRKRKLLFVLGWEFRDRACLFRHQDAVRDFFRPNDEHVENIDKLITTARTGVDVLVGIHIRQGDFATYQGGEFFYSIPQYYEIMQRLDKLFSQRRVRFLVCSMEPVHASSFPHLRVLCGTGHPIEDMYALARCDYLAGPPSTFSAWASFHGKVPWWPLMTADQYLSFQYLSHYWYSL